MVSVDIKVNPNFHAFAKKLKETVEELTGASETFGDLLTSLNTGLNEAKQLDAAALATRIREFNAELYVRMKEDETKLLSDLLSNRGMVAVPTAEFTASEEVMQSKLSALEKELRKELDAAKTEAVSNLNMQIITLNAQLKYADQTIADLKTQISQLQLDKLALLEANQKTVEAMSKRRETVLLQGK